MRVRLAGSSVLNEPAPTPPASATEEDTAAVETGVVEDAAVVVVDEDEAGEDAAALSVLKVAPVLDIDVVAAEDADEVELDVVDVVASGLASPVLVASEMLDEGTLLEPEVSVPEIVATGMPRRHQSASGVSFPRLMHQKGYSLIDVSKKPPGDTAAAVGLGAAAAAATVTPVCTASAAGIDERPGLRAPTAVVMTGALPRGVFPPTSIIDTNGGGLPEPQKQPGGAFIH